jgi:TolB-like protein
VVLGVSGSSEALRRVGDSVSEQILTELGRNELIDAIGTSDVQSMLGIERQKELLGCSEKSNTCMAEMSEALGAPWLVLGSLAQFGKTTRLDLKLIRTKDGKAIFRDGASFKDESDLFELVSAIVKKLSAKLELKPASKPEPAPGITTQPPPRATPPQELVVVAPPPAVEPPPATPLAPVVLTVAGTALAVGGGVAFGVATAQHSALLSQLGNPNAQVVPYSEASKQLGSSRTVMLAGGLVAGAGVATLVGGLAWWLLGKPAEAHAWLLGITPTSVSVQGGF